MAYPRFNTLQAKTRTGAPPPPPPAPPPPSGPNFNITGGGNYFVPGGGWATVYFSVVIVSGTPPYSYNWYGGFSGSGSSTSQSIYVAPGGATNGVALCDVTDATGTASGGGSYTVYG